MVFIAQYNSISSSFFLDPLTMLHVGVYHMMGVLHLLYNVAGFGDAN